MLDRGRLAAPEGCVCVIGFDEALALLEASVVPLGAEEVPLAGGAGRVLAAPLSARCDGPRVAVSAMDGYAVLDAATQPGEALKVIGEAPAGAGFSGKLAAGEAVRIFTGAPMPDGADRCSGPRRTYVPWHLQDAFRSWNAEDQLSAQWKVR